MNNEKMAFQESDLLQGTGQDQTSNVKPTQIEETATEKRKKKVTSTVKFLLPHISTPLILPPPKVEGFQIKSATKNSVTMIKQHASESSVEIDTEEIFSNSKGQLNDQYSYLRPVDEDLTAPAQEEVLSGNESIVEDENTVNNTIDGSHRELFLNQDELPSIQDEASSSRDEFSSTNIESESSDEESSSGYEESSSRQDESSSGYEESSVCQDESSTGYDEFSSSEDESAIYEEFSSSTDESSSRHDESSLIVDEFSSSGDDLDQDYFEYKDSGEILPQKLAKKWQFTDCKQQDQLLTVKLPVLVAAQNIEVDIFNLFEIPLPISSISNIGWSLDSFESRVLLPSNLVFSKGVFTANIEYVYGESSSLHETKILIPWAKTTYINWLMSPILPGKTENEYMFQSNGSEAIYHHEFHEQFADQIQASLRSFNFIWHEESSTANGTSQLCVKGRAELSVDYLQAQFINLRTT